MLNLTVGTRPIPIPIPISIHKWRGQLNQKQLKCKAADNREGQIKGESGEYYYYSCSCCCRGGCCCDVDEVARANDLYFFIEMSTCLLINVEPAYAEWETHLLIMRCMHKQQAGRGGGGGGGVAR